MLNYCEFLISCEKLTTVKDKKNQLNFTACILLYIILCFYRCHDRRV